MIPYYWKDWTIIRSRPSSQAPADLECSPLAPLGFPEDSMSASETDSWRDLSRSTETESDELAEENRNEDNSVYIFNRWCVIQLTVTSNGWFKYLMNRNLCTMYSSGKPVISEAIDAKHDFSRKFLVCKSKVKFTSLRATDSTGPQGAAMFEHENRVYKFGANWSFSLKKETTDSGNLTGNVQLVIANIEGSQVC